MSAAIDHARTLALIGLHAQEAMRDLRGVESRAMAAIAEAARLIAPYTQSICETRDGSSDLHDLAATLRAIGSGLTAHYATPAPSAVDLRNNNLDARSKAQRENVA